MLKKITAALLAAMMALSLTACSGGNEKQESYTGKAYESEILTPGEIVVGVSADYPPYESLNPSTGELEGFDIDMTETLATYMGAEGKEVKVVWKQMEFATIITALQSGQIDLGVAAFTYDPERECLFSDPYLESKQVVVLPAGSTITSFDEFDGLTVGAGLGTTGEAAAKEQLTGAKVTNPGDYTVMFEALKNGALDAVVCDGIVAQNYADTYGFVIMEEPLVLEENSVIVATGNEELLAEVNNAIAQFKASDAYVDLQVKWGLTAAETETTETEGTEESSEAEGTESTPEESSSSEAA